MMLNEAQIEARFPVHYLVWNNYCDGLDRLLRSGKNNLELRDPRGRTSLMLAVTLGHKQCALTLLQYDAKVIANDHSGFNALHEAVTSNDIELVGELYKKRSSQQIENVYAGMEELICKLNSSQDFYVEMKWEFDSWLPFLCEYTDTYRIYKSGSKVRVDATVIGFEEGSSILPKAIRGSKSFIFHGSDKSSTIFELDHIEKCFKQHIEPNRRLRHEIVRPCPNKMHRRLLRPITAIYVDLSRTSFVQQCKLGWKLLFQHSARIEPVHDWPCKVYSMKDAEWVHKSRTEHLTDKVKEFHRKATCQEDKFLALVGFKTEKVSSDFHGNARTDRNPHKLTLLEYFNPDPKWCAKDIGIPRETCIKRKPFKVDLWLCEQFPLSMHEQILPIVQLMARCNGGHFEQLAQLITTHQFPNGFPVKMEVPMFYLVTARVTFANVFASKQSVPGVSVTGDQCAIQDWCFELPKQYTKAEGSVFGIHE